MCQCNAAFHEKENTFERTPLSAQCLLEAKRVFMCIICARIEATQHRTTSTLIHVFDMDPENAHFIYALLLCLSLDVDCVFIKVELKVFSTRRFNMNCYGNGTNERMNERTCAVAQYKKNSNNNIKDQQKQN